METRWVGPDGYEVTSAMRGHRQVLRLRRHGEYVVDCFSVEELRAFVNLADLCEVISLPFGRRPSRPREEAFR
ncbi:transposase [Sphaerisporangium sp. TRM90804]|uniref:transposase n=1 Tax=Sphaerisporangium sp. TRM90804 TaxID=3031113 RepID=UPI002446C018|nr:transposase [Sphaerisporangium sp. TRM90804]MDH2429944.1 transposase [Sphaerisporangium sp. TRM90804]